MICRVLAAIIPGYSSIIVTLTEAVAPEAM